MFYNKRITAVAQGRKHRVGRVVRRSLKKCGSGDFLNVDTVSTHLQFSVLLSSVVGTLVLSAALSLEILQRRRKGLVSTRL